MYKWAQLPNALIHCKLMQLETEEDLLIANAKAALEKYCHQVRMYVQVKQLTLLYH